MKIGQTSLIVFLSKLLGSALGFLATLYFARELGSEVIGLYALVFTVVGWLLLASQLGIGGAIVKRISEGKEEGSYLSAAIMWVVLLGILISIGVVIGKPVLEEYISEFNEYVSLSVIWFVIGIIFIKSSIELVNSTLKGERKVHISGLLDPLMIGGRSIFQIGLVFAGYGLLGMLVGYLLAGILVSIIGLYWVSIRPVKPAKRHFLSLFDYAKFSWLGRLKSRSFNEVDILFLGIFVPTGLVGVYSVAWSIAKFLDLFGSAVSATVFPEISNISARESKQAAAGMIEDALAYTGLVAIPGLIGGILLGPRLLKLYGEDFTQGTAVLGLLILSVLFYSYQKQLTNGLNGLDRPDLAFRINAVFILLNAILNLILIWRYGIEGAAVATAFSAAVASMLSYFMLSKLIEFTIPFVDLSRQWVAGLVMGVIVSGSLNLINATGIIDHNAMIVVGLVILGAGTYFLTLIFISSDFRETVNRNLPMELPYVG